VEKSAAGSPNLKLKTKIKNFSSDRRDSQNLAALVETAGRTHAVRNRWRVALRAFAQLRKFEHAVVSAALTLPAR
jgi:hypothetical protein